MLKGVKMLDNILNEFLEEFEAETGIGPDFAYYYTSSYIQYTLVVSDKASTYFMDHIHKLAPDIKCDVFLISFLHELGHHETMDDLTNEDERFSRDTKVTINQALESKECDPVVEEAVHSLYFNLPDEAAATAWAIQYIRNNPEKMAALWERVQAAIMLIYELNEVEVA